MNDERSASSAGAGCYALLVILALLGVIVIGMVAFLWLCFVIVMEQWKKLRSSEATDWRPTSRQYVFGLMAFSVLFVVVWVAYGLISGNWMSWIDPGGTHIVP